MEELINKFVTLTHIKEAISAIYNELETANTYHDCMELVNDVEKELVTQLTALGKIKF